MWKFKFKSVKLKLVLVILLLLMTHLGRPQRHSQKKCFARDFFVQGYFHGNELRRLERSGPFSCIRECLVRRGCLSINYLPDDGYCVLHSRKTGGNYTLTLGSSFHYLEKAAMYGMVNVDPCNDTICGETERCQILFDNSVVCSVTECKAKMDVFRSWKLSHGTQAVGDHIHFLCVHNVNLTVATYKCMQDGSWRIANYSIQNIQRCNREECQKNRGFIYLEKTNGCYRYLKESKTHTEASLYCSSTFTHGKLFLADSSEKIQAVTKDIIQPATAWIPTMIWIDGVTTNSTETLLTSRGSIYIQKLRELTEYASATFTQNEECLALIRVVAPTVNIRHDCSEKHVFLCEIEPFTIIV